jgi:N-acyl amino acid synthase of PEP-CTERM/exosortase system
MSGAFRPLTIDDSPQLLESSYRMRYQAYCLEQRFLPAEDYPNQLECDEFDRESVHVGVVDAENTLAGTARIVKPNNMGLPVFLHCTLFPHETVLADVGSTVVEVSRVCISRRYNRRRADPLFGAPENPESDAHASPAFERRKAHSDVFATLVKALYHATKRLGATHWIVAVEKPLRRRIAHYGLPFWLAGPDAEYYGSVAPYIMSIAELDRVIHERQFASLDDFPDGLQLAIPQLEQLSNV